MNTTFSPTETPQTETKPLTKSQGMENKSIILAITGTSGAIYGLRMLRALILNEFNIDLILSEYAEFTLFKECGIEIKPSGIQNIFPDIITSKSAVTLHNNLDTESKICSIHSTAAGMIICPCSMNYISGIAHGDRKNLIEKTADYIITYSKPLVIVPRETPLNRIHIENFLKLMNAGASLVPAMPAFDSGPKDFNDLADYIVNRVFDILISKISA